MFRSAGPLHLMWLSGLSEGSAMRSGWVWAGDDALHNFGAWTSLDRIVQTELTGVSCRAPAVLLR
ncbi:hypothetical protein AMK15_16790 [Streptomyces sp. MJM1172]|nr:hypothetical protein AMK15_16790 [Streptomyces sp. MJM1172]